MNEALSAVKLRTTERKTEEVDLKAHLHLERAQNARLRQVDIESWYDSIKEFTYPTAFVPLSVNAANTIVSEYHKLKADSSHDWRQNSTLCQLESEITQAMEENQFSEVFAKLSSRSPKDSRLCQKKAKQLALQRLLELKQHQELSTNDLAVAIMSTGIEVLKMNSAYEVLSTFLTSDRVCEDDLPLALQFPDRWNQHIILRKWVHVPIQFEVRGFVMNKTLTGLTQYFNNAYFPDVLANKEKILRLVLKLFDDIKDRLQIDPPEYVLDIAVLIEEDKALVIELNPFGRPNGMGTGTCLFDRTNLADMQILFGESDFEFRVEERPTSVDPSKYIRGEWKTFFVENGLIS
jgi:hypothetical protein